MSKEKICEINVGKLMSEYHDLSNEILVKSSYLDGVKSRITKEVEEYFSDYRGKYYRMKFDGNTCDEAMVRIGKIKVCFYCDALHINFRLVVNPDDLLCASGASAGSETDSEIIRKIKSAAGSVPVFANTGCTAANIREKLSICDGAVVGTAFKKDGKFAEMADAARVKEFMDIVRADRAEL